MKHTPGPWAVRTHKTTDGELRDCFVMAKDVNGFAYDAEILGEDEYREESGGIERKLADCRLVAAAPELLDALLYYRDQCSGAEPSLSVFHRKLDEAIAKAVSE